MRRQRAQEPPVIAAAPIRELAARLRQLAEAAHALNPSNPMVETLQGVCREMDQAIQTAAAEEAWLTVTDVAARLGVSEEAVRWHIRAGSLAAERAGKQYRVSMASLQTFLNDSRTRHGKTE